ncbi:MAG TPA: hypothetical protein VGH33_13895 [Isosphaeraceae bacterium]
MTRKTLAWGAAGMVLGAIVWACLYLVASLAPPRVEVAARRASTGPPTSGWGAGGGGGGGSGPAGRIDDLDDPFLRGVARAALLGFDRGRVDDAMSAVDLEPSAPGRDEVLGAVAAELLMTSDIVPMAAVDPGPGPRLDLAALQMRRAEQGLRERMRHYGVIEAVAGRIADPLARSDVLSRLALKAGGPMPFGPTDPAAVAELHAFADKARFAALEALKGQHSRPAVEAGVGRAGLFWIGTGLFALAGFVAMTFVKPVIEAFGKAVGDAMVQDADPARLYASVRDTLRHPTPAPPDVPGAAG